MPLSCAKPAEGAPLRGCQGTLNLAPGFLFRTKQRTNLGKNGTTAGSTISGSSNGYRVLPETFFSEKTPAVSRVAMCSKSMDEEKDTIWTPPIKCRFFLVSHLAITTICRCPRGPVSKTITVRLGKQTNNAVSQPCCLAMICVLGVSWVFRRSRPQRLGGLK